MDTNVASMPAERRPTARWGCAIFAAAVLGPLSLMTFERGGYGEFSPFTLEYRARLKYTVLVAIPVYWSAWNYETRLMDFLVAEGLAAPMKSTKDRWDVQMDWTSRGRDGDRTNLKDILFRDRDAIIEWTNADRPRAEEFWSEFFNHLRSDERLDQATAEQMARFWRNCNTIDDVHREIAFTKAGMLYDRIWLTEHGHMATPPAELERMQREFSAIKKRYPSLAAD